ncbi:2-hydroxyacyl-CoA dehydratase family protein [Streptomyces luomodiensis]|uniref:2-hydroxyacyl-CoA dehydratase family protein n=1 Tax=Streptomyces luomodiensis TaxID=3026192 RepID=A0ABY9URJ2_9ACTN|nr:2-hydroxyacyl-CoA dehydratase family protein [Streptomyces sp. SCA4-21]WNE95172.1 2-hydroxyacyl-CoA dehydratase family protein [Streptomyces sp. SCA4-21]
MNATDTAAHRARAALGAASEDRGLHARRSAAEGRPVVGYVGADVPVELITAAGALPVRLAGDPGRDTALARRYLDGAVDPQVVSVLAAILAPGDRDPRPDLVVISHDCDASVQLFYTLRELRRIGRETFPPVHFVDILHLPGDATRAYNLGRLRRFADQLAAWRGRAISAAELEQAVADHNAARAARRQLARHRAARLPGAEALRWYAAQTAMPPRLYARTLADALSGGTAAPAGRPLFVSGSTHDVADVYRALEHNGWHVVGDSHDWGDGGNQPAVAVPTLSGLADHYTRQALSTAARSARRATELVRDRVRETGAGYVLCYCRRHDDAHRLDQPAQAAAAGVPAALLRDQPYGSVDLADLERQTGQRSAGVAP